MQPTIYNKRHATCGARSTYRTTGHSKQMCNTPIACGTCSGRHPHPLNTLVVPPGGTHLERCGCNVSCSIATKPRRALCCSRRHAAHAWGTILHAAERPAPPPLRRIRVLLARQAQAQTASNPTFANMALHATCSMRRATCDVPHVTKIIARHRRRRAHLMRCSRACAGQPTHPHARASALCASTCMHALGGCLRALRRSCWLV